MFTIRYLAVLVLFAVTATQAAGLFPSHPPKLSDAQAQGLHRLSADELKAFIPGTLEVQGHKGGKGKLRIYKPDGTFEVQAFEDRPGTWRIDSNNNTWCRTIYKKKESANVEQCYATFAAADGIYYFDYDVADGFFAAVWRAQSKK
jgi:hypothetical protein